MKLKEYRKKNKLKQRQVADILNISQRTYSHYETESHDIPISFLSVLADFYHTTIDDIVGRQPENLVNLNLLSDEERNVYNNTKRLNKNFQLKVEAFTEFCLQEQAEQEKKNKN